jgi:hypothetical protein
MKNDPRNHPNEHEQESTNSRLHEKFRVQSALSGRLKMAQRFIAGIGSESERKSVKRTTEKSSGPGSYHSAGRFTDYKSFSSLSQQ